MFDANLPTSEQLPQLKAVILATLADKNLAEKLEAILDSNDIFSIPNDMVIPAKGKWVSPELIANGQVRPALLIVAWFYPSYVPLLKDYQYALKSVTGWENLNFWHFRMANKYPVPITVLAHQRFIYHELCAEKEAQYQRKKHLRLAARTENRSTDSTEDIIFLD